MKYQSFSQDFLTSVLGIGKKQQDIRNGYGGQPQTQMLSNPSNETANREFIKIFGKAVVSTCDTIVKKKKEEKKPEKG